LVAALTDLGARIEPAAAVPGLPLDIVGTPLSGSEVVLDAGASSQFVSALMLLAPRLQGGLAIRLVSEPPSRPYLDLTEDVLARFGAGVAWRGAREVRIPSCRLEPAVFEVEADWSAAAFPMAAAALTGGSVEIAELRLDSRQGDAAVARLLEGIGCTVDPTSGGVRLSGRADKPLVACLRDAPDLFPALAVVVASRGGRLDGLAGLAGKESDRLAVMTDRLSRLGFDVRSTSDTFTAAGTAPSAVATGAPLSPADDHRIAMALAVAGSVVRGVRVAEPGCVSKSWPEFWGAWEKLFPNAS
jgi:3-phosphoshikimate 1-carboxyvinyltransferase